jgi:hypothetical protein
LAKNNHRAEEAIGQQFWYNMPTWSCRKQIFMSKMPSLLGQHDGSILNATTKKDFDYCIFHNNTGDI